MREIAAQTHVRLDSFIGHLTVSRAIVKKCGFTLTNPLDLARVRCGHWEIFTGGMWRRSTDLLNTASS